MNHSPVECPLCRGTGILIKFTPKPNLIDRGELDKPNKLDCYTEESKCLNCNGTGFVIECGRYSPIIQIA
jgi:hypothetical protein